MSETITLSDALRRKAALKGDLARWCALYPNSNVWAEDQPKPAYDETEVRAEITTATEALIRLKTAIAHANATCTLDVLSVGGGHRMPLAEAIYRLAENKSLQVVLAGLGVVSEKESVIDRRSYNEDSKLVTTQVKQYASVTTRERDAILKALRDEFASLNSKLEHANNTITVTI
jgi:hypothetical protein